MTITLSSMRDVLTHCVAQQLYMDQDIYSYMQCVVSCLLEAGMEMEDVQDLYVHVHSHAHEEVLIIKDMYARYGIKVNVDGHGGSQIHPCILLDKYLNPFN